MDITVYKVEAEYLVDKIDEDLCRYQDWEIFFSDTFSTKVSICDTLGTENTQQV